MRLTVNLQAHCKFAFAVAFLASSIFSTLFSTIHFFLSFDFSYLFFFLSMPNIFEIQRTSGASSPFLEFYIYYK